MTITRIIDGKTIEITLTEQERAQAYFEEQEANDQCMIGHYVKCMEEDGNLAIPEEVIDDAVAIYRDAVDWNDCLADVREELAYRAIDEALKRQENPI